MSSPKTPPAPRAAAKSAAQSLDTSLSQELAPDASFGGFPVVEGEDPAAYQNLLEDVTRAVAPKDFIERILVRDCVDGTWEVFRLRRLKTGLLRAGRRSALQDFFAPMLGLGKAMSLANQWAAGEEDAVQAVADLLDGWDNAWDEILARALEVKLDAIERTDRMLHQAETRRNRIFKEIERHREALAKRMRDQLALLEDAEVVDAQMALRLSGPVGELHEAVIEERKRRERDGAGAIGDSRQAAPEIADPCAGSDATVGERASGADVPETSAPPMSQKPSKMRP